MNISAPFIRRPVATSLLTAALFLSGLIAYRMLPVAKEENMARSLEQFLRRGIFALALSTFWIFVLTFAYLPAAARRQRSPTPQQALLSQGQPLALLANVSAAPPADRLVQAAGLGSDDVRNQPGYAKPPTGPPRPAPKQPADPQVQAVLDQMNEAGVLRPKTIEQIRKAYLFYTKFAGPPEKVFRVENRIVPGAAGSIPIRVYVPGPGEGLPMWIFFHGGGFVTGNIETHDVVLRAVANRCDCIIVSVGYRLAPQNPFPAAANDAYAATDWVANHAAEIDGDPDRIALGGDGAGGNLAAVVALMARDRGGPRLVYQVLIYPILGATQFTYSWVTSIDPVLTSDAMLAKWSAYIPLGVRLEDPYVSPVDSMNLRHLPPTLIITGANDPVRDDVDHFAIELREAGVPAEVSVYPNTIHGFFLMAGVLDAGRKSVDQIASALRAKFRGAQTN